MRSGTVDKTDRTVTVAGHVAGNGNPSTGSYAFVAGRAALGSYVVRLTSPSPIKAILGVVAEPTNGSAAFTGNVSGVAGNSFNVNIWNAAGAAADWDFEFHARVLI